MKTFRNRALEHKTKASHHSFRHEKNPIKKIEGYQIWTLLEKPSRRRRNVKSDYLVNKYSAIKTTAFVKRPTHVQEKQDQKPIPLLKGNN